MSISNISSAKQNGHLTFRGNVKQGRHGWLRLTPAYSLHVVEDILQDASKEDFVLDPFSGTGTTPLSAACFGIPCHAVDINPFLTWFGNAKVSKYSDETRRHFTKKAAAIIGILEGEKSNRIPWVPPLHQIEKWWDAETLRALGSLLAAINDSVKSSERQIGDLLKIAFCRLMMQFAHVSFGHQSMSFKRREPDLFENLAPKECVWNGFLDSVQLVAKGIVSEQPQAKAVVFLGDSRNLTAALPRKDYSLVITSPPYPNRMSYIRELRPYMYWLGYLENGRQSGELDWNAIGGTWGCATSMLNKWEPATNADMPYKPFANIIDRIRKQHDILGRYVHRYFEDIRSHLASLKKVLVSGAKCHYIVGNSKFYDTLVPVEEIYAALFEEAGFTNVRIDTLRKRNSKKELFEYRVYAEA